MVSFGEPVKGSTQSPVKLKPKGRPARRSTGWHSKSKETWKAREREREKKVSQQNRRRIIAARKILAPCPKCYAPVLDGECQGAYSLANGGLHNER